MARKTAQVFQHHIPIEDIPEDGLSVFYDEMPGLLEGTEGFTTEGPIHGSAFMKKEGAEVYLTGEVKARLVLACDRCLSLFEEPLNASFSYMLVPRKEETRVERAMEGSDVEVTPFDGSRIPIADIFREQVLLNVPFRRLCREGCKGLCPTCGANLNTETCTCVREGDESPFAVLETLI